MVIDDLGYIRQTREEMEVVFTLLAERYERGSVLLTSNLKCIALLVQGTVDPSVAHLQIRLVYAPGAANLSEPGSSRTPGHTVGTQRMMVV